MEMGMEEAMRNNQSGEPGLEGEPGVGKSGGRGGAGGRGGLGQPEGAGGAGGKGGEGGEGAAGKMQTAGRSKGFLRVVQVGYLLGLLVAAFIVGSLYLDGVHANNALCTLQQDFKQRAADTRKFVEENGGPQGAAIPGIPNSTLLVTANNQEHTAKVLDKELNCE